jgi:hypothetical protein
MAENSLFLIKNRLSVNRVFDQIVQDVNLTPTVKNVQK